jgi:hypothetical protein
LAVAAVAIQMVAIRYLAQSHQQVVVLVQILQVLLAVQAAVVVIRIQLVLIQAVQVLRGKVLRAAAVVHHLVGQAVAVVLPPLVLQAAQVQAVLAVLAVLRQLLVHQ